MSGIMITDAAVNTLKNDLQLKPIKYGAITLKMTPNIKAPTAIEVDKTYPVGTSLATILADMPMGEKDGKKIHNEGRYIAFDMTVTESQGYGNMENNKLFLLMWTPDSAPTRERMIYSSSKEGLMKKIGGAYAYMQITDPADLTEKVVMEKYLHASNKK